MDRITLTFTKNDDGEGMTIVCSPDDESTWTFSEYCEALSAAVGAAADSVGWTRE